MKYFLVILFLLLMGANSLAQTELELVGVILTTDQQPLSGVEVKVIGGGRDVTTTSGEFRIKLPTSSVGQRVVLQVTKMDWTISNPRELHIIVPADPIQNPLIIRMKKTISTRQPSSNNLKGSIGSRKPTTVLERKTKSARTRTARSASASDKTIVLVANFSSIEEQNNAVTETIIGQLRNATRGYSDIKIQSLGETITAQEGSEVAHGKGKEHKASIVLWGWYSKSKEKVLINAYFEVLQSPRLLSLQQENQILLLPISELENFSIQFRLSSQMSYLTLLTVGLARLDVEDFDSALDRFTSAINLPSVPDQIVDPADLYFYRGLTYLLRAFLFSEEDLERAIVDFDEAIKLNGNKIKPILMRTLAYSQKQDWDQVIADSDRALTLEPDGLSAFLLYSSRGLAYLSKGDRNRALTELDQALKSCECPAGFREYMQAMIFFMKEDFDQSIVKLNEAIKLESEPFLFSLLTLMRGGVYGMKKDYVRALADLDQVVKLNPKWPKAYLARGLFFAETNNYERAIAEYTEAIKLDPTFIEAYKERGEIYGKKRVYNKAIEDYNKAVSLNSNNPDTYYDRGYIYDIKGDLDHALSDYNQAIKLKADYPYPYYQRASVFDRKGDTDRAFDDINQFIKLAPDDEDGYSYRGNLYLGKDDLDRALSDYDQAIKLKADYAYAYFCRSYAYERKGDLDRSIADLSQYIKLEPNQARGYFYRGLAYANKSDRDQAIPDLKKAIELTSDARVRQQAEKKLQQLGVK